MKMDAFPSEISTVEVLFFASPSAKAAARFKVVLDFWRPLNKQTRNKLLQRSSFYHPSFCKQELGNKSSSSSAFVSQTKISMKFSLTWSILSDRGQVQSKSKAGVYNWQLLSFKVPSRVSVRPSPTPSSTTLSSHNLCGFA